LPTPERLYYSDSSLTRFTGSVRAVREAVDDSSQPIWHVSLDRTVFYPTSGGQPFDTGVLRADSLDGSVQEIPVEQVEEDEDGAVVHFVRKPLSAGTQVEGRINWDRRFDHMQQHTGQHLLSAVLLRELQLPTVSFHLGENISTIDLAGGPVATTILERVERIANEIIGEDRPVTTRFVPRSEAEAMLAAGGLRKLPDREGDIRLVEIRDCDLNACGGTHVHSTGQIGGLLVRGAEKVSRGTRVAFICGLRAVQAARADKAILGETAALLSTGAAELPAAVARLLDDGKANARERQKLREELATFHAAKMTAETPLENGLRLVMREWKDQDREFIRLLASRTAAAAPLTAAIFSAKDTDPVRIFVSRSPDLKFNSGQILRELLARMGLRGGGSADMAQGEVPASHELTLRAELASAIRRAVADSPN